MKTFNTPVQKGTLEFVNDQSVVLDLVGNDLVVISTDRLRTYDNDDRSAIIGLFFHIS